MVERFFAFGPFDGEHVAEAFFEKVGPPQSRVGFGYPVELLTLTWVEIVGVLPQCVTRPRNLPGVASGPSPPAGGWGDSATSSLVPGSSSFDVEGFDRPGDNMERVGTPDRIRSTSCHSFGDPVGHVR